jgi:CheY-like chemotaxis protein
MTHLNHDHRTILLIDQNPTKQNLRATILRNYEIEVHTASSLTDAAALWASHFYDLVLLAAPANSEAAAAVCSRIRHINPEQRIALLVGPPAFIQELGGRRRKVASIGRISPSRAWENPSAPVPAPHASSPQWQEMIRKLVADWYVDQQAFWASSKPIGQSAGA